MFKVLYPEIKSSSNNSILFILLTISNRKKIAKVEIYKDNTLLVFYSLTYHLSRKIFKTFLCTHF